MLLKLLGFIATLEGLWLILGGFYGFLTNDTLLFGVPDYGWGIVMIFVGISAIKGNFGSADHESFND